MRKSVIVFTVIVFSTIFLIGQTKGARIKDIANLKGVRNNQLLGYGLVVGLDDTGDSSRTGFTSQTLANMLERLNISTNVNDINVNNVAAVMVTAKLPPFAKYGDSIDVVVSSIGDAESLAGGTLMQTPLHGPRGRVFAVAQGPLSVGGLSYTGAAASVQKNHPTVARIADGAIVEREVSYKLPKTEPFTYTLNNPDFTTVSRIVSTINQKFGNNIAKAIDGGSFQIAVPKTFENHRVQFISAVEKLQIEPDSKAKVVVNERTGTIVVGKNVRLSKVAVSHGNLKLIVKESAAVSQPPAFSGGGTVAVPKTKIKVQEEEGNLVVMDKGVSLGQIASALNAIGATPRDLISIFQAIKASGALHAKLIIM